MILKLFAMFQMRYFNDQKFETVVSSHFVWYLNDQYIKIIMNQTNIIIYKYLKNNFLFSWKQQWDFNEFAPFYYLKHSWFRLRILQVQRKQISTTHITVNPCIWKFWVYDTRVRPSNADNLTWEKTSLYICYIMFDKPKWMSFN